jgi:hypothetical protein
MKVWREFLFEDGETGEPFIVDVLIKTEKNKTEKQIQAEAQEIAEEYFEEPTLIRELTEDEAERLGYDTY